MIFSENMVPYGQDFRFFVGVPTGVDFEVVPFTASRVKLIAPGYGGVPYGNGALYVSKQQMQFKQQRGGGDGGANITGWPVSASRSG